MPVMTGTEAVDRMRAIQGLKDVPVIAVTASSLRHEEGNLRERFDGYLRKPFSRAELYRETGRFLTRAKERPGSASPEISPDGPAPQAHAVAWQEAVRRLRQMEVSTWAALQNTLAITEVRNFAWRLQLLAESADCPPLRAYAEILHTHAANFAADDLEAHLAAFPQLISLLETRGMPS